MPDFWVDSEIGRLRKVLLHCPDLELARLTPANIDDMLFDEIMWADRARLEHQAFAGVLRGRGVEVFLLADLLATALADEGARKELLDRVVTVDGFGAGLAFGAFTGGGSSDIGSDVTMPWRSLASLKLSLSERRMPGPNEMR